jgi:hypothetical protein
MLSIWQSRILGRLSKSLEPVFGPAPGEHAADGSAITTITCTRPSPELLEALVSLTSAADQLGLSYRQMREKQVLRDVLDQLSQKCFHLVEVEILHPSNSTSQLVWDLHFLKVLCRETGIQDRGDDTLKKLQIRVRELC